MNYSDKTQLSIKMSQSKVNVDLSRLVVEPATPADYDDVIAINPWIYDGLDYLHSQYMEFIHTTHTYPYLARYEGKVVSEL